jgi:hypothetical protein
MRLSFGVSFAATCALTFLQSTVVVKAGLTEMTSSLGNLDNPDDQGIHLYEDERREEYVLRNYTWPLQKYTPDNPGWKALMEKRLYQITEMEHDRYEGFMQTIPPAMLVPNFTEHGFGLARCPDDLIEALRQGIRDGLPTAGYEYQPPVIQGPKPPLFVNRPDLTRRAIQELKHYAETWAGLKLTPYRAYGFRLYQNESSLLMHVDKTQTHIISFILHIDSSEDADPWPIFIEVSAHYRKIVSMNE